MKLEGSALVTGAASGIGAAVARTLASHGLYVVVADIQADQGEAIAQAIGGVFAQVDVTKTEQIAVAVEMATAVAPLKAVVNSAGISTAHRTIGRDGKLASAFDLSTFRRIVEVNLVGTFDVVRQAATAMSRNEPDKNGQRGAIVNLSSVAAFDGQIGQTAYAASKGGVVSLTLPLARDLAAVGIRVNTVAPGLIDTPIYDGFPKPDEFKARLGLGVLFPQRLGAADELASMVTQLLINDYMNAETVRVDGGIRLPAR